MRRSRTAAAAALFALTLPLAAACSDDDGGEVRETGDSSVSGSGSGSGSGSASGSGIAEEVEGSETDNALVQEAVADYQVWVQHKYAGYLERQRTEIQRFRHLESKRIPADFDYTRVPGLLLEAREKFGRVRPMSLGQAARIPGVTPADLSILLIFLKRHGADGGAPAAAGLLSAGPDKGTP